MAGWVRLVLQIAALVFLAGAAWWRLSAIEEKQRELAVEVTAQTDSLGAHRERITGVEIRTLGMEGRLDRIEGKIDRLLDRQDRQRER